MMQPNKLLVRNLYEGFKIYTKNRVKTKKVLEKKSEIFLFFLAIVALFILILSQL